MLGAEGKLVELRAGIVHSKPRGSQSSYVEDLLILPGMIGGLQTDAVLLDSGATSNFMSEALASRCGIRSDVLGSKFPVKLANGQLVECSLIASDVSVVIGDHDASHPFLILPELDGCDVILGRLFLKRAAAIVDHASGEIRFPRRSKHKLKIAKSTGHGAVLSSLLSDIASGLDERSQDSVLRACGLAAMPSNSVVIPTIDSVDPEVSAEIARVVEAYVERMKPFVGSLPPSRGSFDHSVKLVNEQVRPKKRRAIPLNNRHQQSLSKELKRLLDAGHIRVSRSEWAAPVFFVPKNETEDRMVCDFRALNSVIVNNSSSLPSTKELFARIQGCVIFSTGDLTSGYHQLRVKEEDVHLLAFITPHGHFEWVVMPFGEKNAPASFTQLMSQLVLKDYVHSFVLVYQDDFLVASKSAKDHVKHVELVLAKLSEHQLWINPAKCSWGVREVDFLGHHIRATATGTVIEPIKSKIDAVMAWPTPTSVSELRAFLGFVNYYRAFVMGFSAIAAVLTGLTGRGAKFEWLPVHDQAFQSLKRAVCRAPALLTADDDKQFYIHCDASSYAVGAVLSQKDTEGELRPVGYFSRKLSSTQLRWDVYEREIYSVVAALEHWQMHLKGTALPIAVFTDHRSLEYLTDQVLTPKQSRWLTFLSDFRFFVKWIPADENAAADALSRRSDHDDGSLQRRILQTMEARRLHEASGNSFTTYPQSDCSSQSLPIPIAASSSLSCPGTVESVGVEEAKLNSVSVVAVSTSLTDRIRAAYEADPWSCSLLIEPDKHGYFVVDGLLMRHGDHGILVPNEKELRTDIMSEAHDMPTSGHFGAAKTVARIAGVYYWPGMTADVANYVAHCELCQRNKHLNQKSAGLLKPLPITDKGQCISLDFLGGLPRSKHGKNCILVVVDKITKRAYYEACTVNTTAKQTAEILFRRVVREQGLPASIVSDRDSRFTSRVWRELWFMCGTKLDIATAHHQQTDGQSERQIRTLEEYLRSFVNDSGRDWDERLVHAELAYNTSKHASTGFAPLMLHAGLNINLPLSLIRSSVSVSTHSSAAEMLQRMHDDVERAKVSLERAQQQQKKYYDRHHRAVVIVPGDFVFLSTADTVSSVPGPTVFRPIFDGPFEVTAVSDDGLNVTINLPTSKRHNTFHVSKVKKALMPLHRVQPPSIDHLASNSSQHNIEIPQQVTPSKCEEPVHSHVANDFILPLVTDVLPLAPFSLQQHVSAVCDHDDRAIPIAIASGTVENELVAESDSSQDPTEGSQPDDDSPQAPESSSPLTDSSNLRRSTRSRAAPDRYIWQGRIGDQLGISR